MDTTQEELIAALVRRLEGRSPYTRRRPVDAPAVEPDLDVLIELDDPADDRTLRRG